MKNNWVYIGLIAILAFVAVQFWDSAPKLLNPDSTSLLPGERFPYAMIEQPHSKHFDENGRLSYEFIANKLLHYRLKLDAISDGDYTVLNSVELTLHTTDSDWFATATTGTLTNAGNTLTLQDNVRIWQPHEDGSLTELSTSQLVILLRQKMVSTEQPVTISAPQGKLEAIGMVVELETKNIHLKSNVRGYHEPI